MECGGGGGGGGTCRGCLKLSMESGDLKESIVDNSCGLNRNSCSLDNLDISPLPGVSAGLPGFICDG